MRTEADRKAGAMPARIGTSRVWLPALLFILLALPSVYLLCWVPPLWRDSDAFYQVATKFEFLTVLHWPPLYCFCARLPFLLATILDGSLFHSGFSFNWPRVTDLGVYLLLVFQHLFLIGALLSVCVTLAKSWPVRLLIGAVFASCAPIYVFAHCVGSEAIMAPLLMLAGTAGLKYLCSRSPRWLILLFCFTVLNILDRHANGVIAGLVPLAILSLLGLAVARPSLSPPAHSSISLRTFFVTAAVGVVAILTANAVILGVCRLDKIPYRSRAGYAFVWRLDFIKDLPPERQSAIINKAETDLQDPALTAALEKLKEMSARGEFTPDAICEALDKVLGEEGLQGQKRHVAFDQKLNRFFTYFVGHDPTDLFHVVAENVGAGMSFTPSLLTKDPFLCTDWLGKRLSEPRFQPIQGLKTLSSYSEPTKQYNTSFYFHIWAFLPLFVIAGVVIVTGVLYILKAKNWRDLVLGVYSLVCTAIGVVCAVVSFIVVALLPRLMLPTLILLLFAAVVLLLRLDPSKVGEAAKGRTGETAK
jgi:hypothetical protein